MSLFFFLGGGGVPEVFTRKIPYLLLYLYLHFPFTHSFVFALALAFVHSCTRPFAMLSTNWLCEHDPPFHVDPSGCPPTVPVTAPKRISEQPFPYFFHFSILHFHHFFVSSRVMGMPSSQCTTLYFLSTSEPAPITSKNKILCQRCSVSS